MDQRRRLLPWAVLAVTVGLAATYTVASAFPPATLLWLSKDGLYGPSESEQYYTTIGAPAVFADWLSDYGFLSNADEVQAIYYNGGDLGFGREMHCREQPGSYVACYVANHGLGPAGPPAAAVDDAVGLRNDLGTVAMVYLPTAITNTVRFYIYDTGGSLAPNLPRLNGVPLDSQGVKNGPSMCLACHGGTYHTITNSVSGANFLPFDVESFKYSPQPGYRLADQQEAFRQLNRLVLHTNPTPLIQELINKWYAGTGGINQEGAVFNPTVVADAYDDNPADIALYNDVVKPYCRTCHVAQTSWVGSPNQFNDLFPYYWNDIYRDFVMPHAELTSHNFWSSRAPIELANNRGWAARVTKTADTFDGTCNADCSLRDAVAWANTHGGGPVTFNVDGTFTLSAGELLITQRVVILGNGAHRTILDGGGANRVLHLQGATANLLLRGVTIQNGLTNGQGGGLLNEGGQLYLDASVVRNNVSTQDGFWGGGGVASTNTGGTPTLEITNSTIGPGNQAETSDGGGILNLGGVLTVTNTTISGNRAEVGGGLFTQGGSSQAFVTHSTITLNHATQTGGGLISFDHLRLRNSLVAGNTADGLGYRNCTVSIGNTSVVLQGRNLLGLTGNCPNNPADLIWPDRVSDLLNTGLAADARGVGYHALLPTSAALDTLPTGATAACGLPTYDQRGLARPLRGRDSAACDIGAHEFLSITVSSTADTVADDGVCTLREAIQAANTGTMVSSNLGECPPHVDWIELVGQAQYNLTGAPLVVRTGLTLNGHGATVRRTGGTGRLFEVAGGGNLSLLNLTLRNGSQAGSGNGGSGGALLVQAGGTANVLGSAILNNTSQSWGGGIANMGTLNLANSTVSGNRADVDSGGVDNTGTATLVNVTITNNTANADGLLGGDGGGLGAFGGAVTVKGSLIAGNFDAGAPIFPDVYDAGDPAAASAGPSAEGPTPGDQARRTATSPNVVQALYLASADFNVVGNGTGAASAFSQPQDRVGTDAEPLDPRLGALAGSPAYHPLLAGSPALDRIPAFNCTYLSAALGNPLYQAGDNVPDDQRGQVRPLSGTGLTACDAGAFEYQPQVFVPLVRR